MALEKVERSEQLGGLGTQLEGKASFCVPSPGNKEALKSRGWGREGPPGQLELETLW